MNSVPKIYVYPLSYPYAQLGFDLVRFVHQKSLGPGFTLIFGGGGEEWFIHEFRFPSLQTFFFNETGSRAKPRRNTVQYFYFDSYMEANTHTKNMIISYFASRQKREKYNWHQIDIWAFRSSLPSGRQASSLPTGRQASSVPIRKENKATGAIVDVHLKDQQDK